MGRAHHRSPRPPRRPRASAPMGRMSVRWTNEQIAACGSRRSPDVGRQHAARGRSVVFLDFFSFLDNSVVMRRGQALTLGSGSWGCESRSPRELGLVFTSLRSKRWFPQTRWQETHSVPCLAQSDHATGSVVAILTTQPAFLIKIAPGLFKSSSRLMHKE